MIHGAESKTFYLGWLIYGTARWVGEKGKKPGNVKKAVTNLN